MITARTELRIAALHMLQTAAVTLGHLPGTLFFLQNQSTRGGVATREG